MPLSSPEASRRRPQRTPLIVREDVDGKGRGVFAVRAFEVGDEVLEFFGEIRDVRDFEDLTHALQVGPTTFIGPSGGVDDYVNHSCDPNTGICNAAGRIVLFALRPIARGQEITFDYSTTQSGGHWTMSCQCGAANCRGCIGDFEDLPAHIQDFYIARRAVLPFLIRENV